MVAEINIEKTSKMMPFSFGWYISLLAKKPLLTSQMIIASLFVQFFALGTPLFYMVIFDRVFGRQNLSTLDVIAVGLILVVVFDLLIKVIRSFVLSHLLEEIDKQSVDIFTDKLFKLKANNSKVFKIYSESFSEIFKINQVIANSLLVLSLDTVFSLFVVSFLFMLNSSLALVTIAPLVPLTAMIFLKTPHLKKKAAVASQNQKINHLKLSEIIDNAETIRSTNCSSSVSDKFSKFAKRSIEVEFFARYEKIFANSDMSFVMTLGSFAILYFGAHEVLSGQISFGVYLAISIIGRNFIGGVQRLLTSCQQFYEILPSLSKLKEVWGQIEQNEENEGICLSEVKGSIRLQEVNFTYSKDFPPAVNNISFEIPPGAKVAITGKSGSGKTTLVNLIQKLLTPQNGFVSIDGVNISNIDESSLRSHMGVVIQKPQVFTGTVMDNIKLAQPTATSEDVLRVASFIKLDDFLIKNPKGLNAQISPKGINLSSCQLAQIALARVLIIEPKILIIDGTLDNIDQSLQEIIYDRILEKYKNSTCIFVSNNIFLHQKVEAVSVMHNGQIVEMGNYEQLTNAKGYYYHMYSKSLKVG